MALQADDETIINAPVLPVPFALRFRKATLILSVPRVDANGLETQVPMEMELAYDNPALTDNQRTQFIATAKFIAKKNGVIA